MTEEEEAAYARADLSNRQRIAGLKMKPMNEMEAALEELKSIPSYRSDQERRKREEEEYERMTHIPVILTMIQMGYAKSKRDEEPTFMMKFGTDGNEINDPAVCWIAIPEEFTKNFVIRDQEFSVEVMETATDNLASMSEWIETHLETIDPVLLRPWSLKIKANRRHWQKRDGTLIFSFSNMQTAALFKLMYS